MFFAGSEADTPNDTRYGQTLANDREGFCKFGVFDQLNLFGDIEMNRTGVQTGGRQF